ncbi:MAG: ATP-binding protein [Nitratireductor sp.]
MRAILLILFLVISGIVSYSAYNFAFSRLETTAIKTSQNRLSLYSANLRASLERLSHLPKTISIYPNIVDVLSKDQQLPEFNSYLESVNDFSGGAALYVMDTNGDTIASSNFKTAESFIGKNYGFRPYFTKAMEGEEGRVFAVGATTGRPGYFVSRAIKNKNNIIGIAVVKTEFDNLLSDWQKADETVLITDKDGVIFLASQPQYTYKTINRLKAETLSTLITNKKFGTFTPTLLNYTSEKNAFVGSVEIANESYEISTLDIENTQWKIHYLTPLAPQRTAATFIAGLVFILFALAGFIFLYLRGIMNRKKLERATAEAEQIRTINTKLKNEIEARKETQVQLVEAQDELIQSSRLAALGTMSAAIVHEVNQPVAAIRTLTSSGSVLTKANRKEELLDVFEQIKNMTERLGIITSDLLVFSRKPIAKPIPVDLSKCIQVISKQFALLIKEKNVTLNLSLKNETLYVLGSQVRFEQLISNLLKNALDACPPNTGEINIEAMIKNKKIHLEFKDNGEGIAQDMAEKLFDPFVTTKKVGKGVGLGLSLCYAIVSEAGGKISIMNNAKKGATIKVELPAVLDLEKSS